MASSSSSFKRHLRMLIYVLILFGILPLLGYLHWIGGPIDDIDGMTTLRFRRGFWSETEDSIETKKTRPFSSNVNWCEEDYKYTSYIAEWWNSISSLLMIFSGCYGYVRHRSTAEEKYLWAFFFFGIVGFGSFLFHATLRRSTQLMDELPMLWVNSFFIYIVRTMDDPPGIRRRIDALIGICGTVSVTIATVLYDRENQTIFLLSYGTGVLYLIVRSAQFPSLDETVVMKKEEGNDDTIRNRCCGPERAHEIMLEIGILFYGVAFFCWLVDRAFCNEWIRLLQLHSIWHIGADLGTYTALIGWLFRRQAFLKKRPRLRGQTPLTRWCDVEIV